MAKRNTGGGVKKSTMRWGITALFVLILVVAGYFALKNNLFSASSNSSNVSDQFLSIYQDRNMKITSRGGLGDCKGILTAGNQYQLGAQNSINYSNVLYNNKIGTVTGSARQSWRNPRVDHDCSAETIYQLKDATFTPNTSSSSSSSSSSSTAICLAYDFDENKITNLDDLDIFANLWRNKTDISLTSKETFTTTLRNYLNKLKGLDYSDILKLEKDMTPCGIQSELNS